MINYSIIATTYNDSIEILNYLCNICEQSILPDEIVIADGGSRDDTVNIIKEFALSSKVAIRIIEGKRLNISQGYNVAIKNAKNDLIGITGIGNYYENRYFEKLITCMQESNYDLIYSPIRGKDNGIFSVKYNNTILHGNNGLKLPIASNHGALIQKKIFEEIGYFYENFIYAGEDSEFYTLVKTRGYKTKRIDNANVFWFTPITFNEYLKQIKNYSIAELQIHNTNILLKNIIIFLIPILLLICLMSKPVLLSIYIGTIFTFLIVLTLKFKTEKKSLLLWLCNKFLPAVFYFRYAKYFKKQYKVNRQ